MNRNIVIYTYVQLKFYLVDVHVSRKIGIEVIENTSSTLILLGIPYTNFNLIRLGDTFFTNFEKEINGFDVSCLCTATRISSVSYFSK